MTEYQAFLQFATGVARAAGAVIREGAQCPIDVQSKGLRDLLTNVDLAAERTIVEAIREQYPDHDILTEETPPAFIVDTTGQFEAKRAAIACYGSRLHTAEEDVRPTRIGKPDLLKDIEARDRYFGTLIERTHGEPFALAQSLPMDDPVAHFLSFPMT